MRLLLTRNMHAHLCLTPDYARASYAGTGEARVARAMFVVGRCFVSVASKPR